MSDKEVKSPPVNSPPPEGEEAAAEAQPAVEEEAEAVEEVFNMAEDEHYPEEHVEKPFVDSALS